MRVFNIGCAYVGSPDGHEAIASGVGILEHGTLPFISSSCQPAGKGERRRDRIEKKREGRGIKNL